MSVAQLEPLKSTIIISGTTGRPGDASRKLRQVMEATPQVKQA